MSVATTMAYLPQKEIRKNEIKEETKQLKYKNSKEKKSVKDSERGKYHAETTCII